MSHEPNPAESPALSLPVLTAAERRVLGVLVEKAKTTPDGYPMSLNSLVTGSNQKSNRDPIMNLSDLDVEEALASAQQKGLVTRIQGGRVEKWRHNLYEVWQVNKLELAVLAELLLRGAQTEGELRGRASRMEPIADLDALRGVLRPLVERRLVVYLGPEGRRGTTLTHGFCPAAELERLRTSQVDDSDTAATGAEVSAPSSSRPPNPQSLPSFQTELAEIWKELATLRDHLHHLQGALDQVTKEVHTLKGLK